MLPLFGGLIFVGFVVIALVVDIALLGVTYRTAASQADIAAEAGASMIHQESLHAGQTVLDVDAAAAESLSASSRLGLGADDVSVEVDADAICATVSVRYRTFALAFMGAQHVDVAVQSCASPAIG
ncbi:MAG: hypothetical protein ACR2N7_05790 [Acidimicrobiia bacterium]